MDDSLHKSRRNEFALKDDAEPPEQRDCHPPDAHDSPSPSNPVRLGSPARVQHQRQPSTSDHASVTPQHGKPVLSASCGARSADRRLLSGWGHRRRQVHPARTRACFRGRLSHLASMSVGACNIAIGRVPSTGSACHPATGPHDAIHRSRLRRASKASKPTAIGLSSLPSLQLVARHNPTCRRVGSPALLGDSRPDRAVFAARCCLMPNKGLLQHRIAVRTVTRVGVVASPPGGLDRPRRSRR